MEKTVEKKEPSSIKDYKELNDQINIELRDTIHVLEMLVEGGGCLPEGCGSFVSTPAILIRALEGTLEKVETLDTIFDRNVNIVGRFKEEKED